MVKKFSNRHSKEDEREKRYECETCSAVNYKDYKVCGECDTELPEYPVDCMYWGCNMLVSNIACKRHECLLEKCKECRIENHPFCWFHKCKVQGCTEPSLDLGNLCTQHK